MDRLQRPAPAGGRFEPRTLPAKDPAAFVAAGLRAAPSRHQARVTVHAPAAELERRPYLWGTVEAIDDERCTYRTSDDSLDWLAMRIGMLGVDFEVHEPPELAERCAQLAARFARASGESGG
jgi:predicted DNA-binding transcriptional regulator YafY